MGRQTMAQPGEAGSQQEGRMEDRRRWERKAREANESAIREGRPGGHPEIDAKLLALTRIAVSRIDEDRSLMRIGLDNIERWTTQKGGYLPLCHAEWKKLIETEPWERTREMLLEESEEGQRLRSSHPFKGLVSEMERKHA